MHIQKTILVLILALAFTGACNPSPSAKQANSPAASMGGVAQPLPATPAPITSPSQPEVSSPTVQAVAPTESKAAQSTETDPDFNPESSFPLAPNTQWDAGNGDSEEIESSGAFLLHSRATMGTVNQFYQSALPGEGWKLRYIDANYGGGVTQYWEQDEFYMSVDFAYDATGLAIQAEWHQVDLQAVQMLPKALPLPDQTEFVDATDATWQVYIPQEVEAVAGYYQQKATELNWKPESVPGGIEISSGDEAINTPPSYPPGVMPMPTTTPDPRQPQTLVYTMADGNEISLEFNPHQDATILNITLTLKNVESAGLPKELPIYPGATDMVIAPGMVRFTAPLDLKTAVQFYTQILTVAGWKPSAGYSLDTPQLYFQEWDKGEEALRFNISSPGSSSQSSIVSIQCLQCTAP